MKSLLCFCGILLAVFPLFNVQRNDVFSIGNISSVYFVQREEGKQVYIKQEKQEFSQIELAKNEGVILEIENSSLKEVCESLSMQIVKCEVVDGQNTIFGWTDMYSDFVWLQGKQVNVQLLESDKKIVVGFPIILSGF